MVLPENAIPAGSLPPQQKEEGKATNSQPEKESGQGKETSNDKPILGKFKSIEDLIPAYENLERDHGRLGAEVGALRRQNEMLMNLIANQGLANPQGQNAQQAVQEPDYDKLLEETARAVEEGDLSVGEGMKRVAELTAKKTAAIARETYSQLESERTAKGFVEKFQQEHPDYIEALQSGELEAIKAKNPMHDNLSAFFEWKALRARAEAEQKIREAFEKGRTEVANLAAGAQAAGRVLAKPGSEARQINTTQGIPTTEAEKIQGMLEALRAARGGG